MNQNLKDAGALAPGYLEKQEALRKRVALMHRKAWLHPVECPLPRRAWTGGDNPTKETWETQLFRCLVSFFFREQLRECGGLSLWESAGTSALQRARIFWGRAKADAWATYREKPEPLDETNHLNCA